MLASLSDCNTPLTIGRIKSGNEFGVNPGARGRFLTGNVTPKDRSRSGKRAAYASPEPGFRVPQPGISVDVRREWSRRPELNRRPTDYESVALPTELRRPVPASILQGLVVAVKGGRRAEAGKILRLSQQSQGKSAGLGRDEIEENWESCGQKPQPLPQRIRCGRGKAACSGMDPA